MPWLRSGTVSCTQNSSTVTGANTGFAANARVGDAFLGPDGRWYEVANIASDTVLSIQPSYLGPTVPAGTYALAPMQGYVKDSADALRALVNKFGALASSPAINALSSLAGSAGMVPYFNAPDSMATVRMTASPTDSTEGRLLKVGDFGLGGLFSPVPPTGTNLNSLGVVGTYRLDNTYTAAPPSLNGGNARNGDIADIKVWNQGVVHQTYYGIDSQVFYRKLNLETAKQDPWVRLFTGNNIVGTVSQAAGVPTGAILERGFNGNGSYTKYADGTLECWVFFLGNYQGTPPTPATLINWTFPAAFAGFSSSANPGGIVVQAGICYPTANDNLDVTRLSAYAAGNTYAVCQGCWSPAQPVYLSLTAKGRWF